MGARIPQIAPDTRDPGEDHLKTEIETNKENDDADAKADATKLNETQHQRNDRSETRGGRQFATRASPAPKGVLRGAKGVLKGC